MKLSEAELKFVRELEPEFKKDVENWLARVVPLIENCLKMGCEGCETCASNLIVKGNYNNIGKNCRGCMIFGGDRNVILDNTIFGRILECDDVTLSENDSVVSKREDSFFK